jgi:nucleotidyltransferase/DNA polymerase involved in DNA repair
MADRIILHVDMDAFYASIEQRDNPALKGKPVIVGADPKGGQGRGVVAACSYEARKFGVHSALPISRAWKLCPQGAYVRPRMDRYIDVSHQVMEVLRQFTDLIEPLSIDEAFMDITGSIALFGSPQQIARSIKKRIRENTDLCASVGVGPNKFIAKIASDLRKPDALVIVQLDEVEEFLRDLPISRLWGVGPKTELRLKSLGLRTIGDIRDMPRQTLVRALGSLGDHLHELAQGKDERPVIPNWEAKSVSNETTFDEDTADVDLLIETIRGLAARVGRRLRREDQRAGRITLKLRYADFETHTKQTSLDSAVQTDQDIAGAAIALFRQFPLNRKIRLIGVGAADLTRDGKDPTQLDLFSAKPRKEILDRTVDEIRERFGEDSVRRGY